MPGNYEKGRLDHWLTREELLEVLRTERTIPCILRSRRSAQTGTAVLRLAYVGPYPDGSVHTPNRQLLKFRVDPEEFVRELDARMLWVWRSYNDPNSYHVGRPMEAKKVVREMRLQEQQ
ncbi:MAG: hypothetical protein KGI89_03070 [Euryarchaeota archaeon]|nr:hypothetical protein [Euryarchaeota archaeon]